MLLGAIAGAAGVWAMDRVGWFLYNHEDKDAVARELQARMGGNDVEYTDVEQEALDRQPQAYPAGKDVAHAGVEKVAAMTGINVRTGQPNPSGVALHYALGILPGALDAVVCRKVTVMQAGGGALYGLGLFVVNDEMVAPSLGLAAGPKEYPWQAHARGWLPMWCSVWLPKACCGSLTVSAEWLPGHPHRDRYSFHRRSFMGSPLLGEPGRGGVRS